MILEADSVIKLEKPIDLGNGNEVTAQDTATFQCAALYKSPHGPVRHAKDFRRFIDSEGLAFLLFWAGG